MSDSISRQNVIDTIDKYISGFDAIDANFLDGLKTAKKLIKELPSVHPEIIRCKDCKNSEHWYRDKRRCFLWEESGIDVFDNGFCNYAERRQDG